MCRCAASRSTSRSRSIAVHSGWFFEPNDEPLWAQIRLNIGAFMNALFRQGAFQGSSPREAYLVKCDRETTTQDDINRGVVNILVGFAPLKPAEFVVISIQQLAGQIQV
jgi:phage tail sheath protein FI